MIINLFGNYVNVNHIATVQNVGTDEGKKASLTINSSITFEGKTAEEIYNEIKRQIMLEKQSQYPNIQPHAVSYGNGQFMPVVQTIYR